jgi:hypothetical protein
MRKRRTFSTNIGRPIPRDNDGTISLSWSPGFRLRKRSAHDVIRLRHKGWWVDNEQDATTHGVVFRLPSGRGFLAGYTCPWEDDNDNVELTVYDDEETAARVADQMAERYAEICRHDEEMERLKVEAEELPEIIRLTSVEIRDLVSELKFNNVPPHCATAAREKIARAWRSRRKGQKRLKEIQRTIG